MFHIIADCATAVYIALGPGHSEIVYHKAMEVELRTQGIRYESKVILPIYYRSLTVGYGEADLIVYENEDDLNGTVVELKAVGYTPRQGEYAQVRSYLRSRAIPEAQAILINFRQPTSACSAPDVPDIVLVTEGPSSDGGSTFTHAEKDSDTNDSE
jgi:GxxExxY protein